MRYNIYYTYTRYLQGKTRCTGLCGTNTVDSSNESLIGKLVENKCAWMKKPLRMSEIRRVNMLFEFLYSNLNRCSHEGCRVLRKGSLWYREIWEKIATTTSEAHNFTRKLLILCTSTPNICPCSDI